MNTRIVRRTMRTGTLTAMVLLAPAALGQLPEADEPAPARTPASVQLQPKLRLPILEHDFGRIYDGNVVEFAFPFINEGPGRLVVSRIKGSCGCTIPDLQKTEFEAGEADLIKVTFNPHGKSGRQRTTVDIFTNDPAQPRAQVVLKCDIKTLVAIEPKVVKLGPVRRGEPAEGVVHIIGRSEDFEANYVTVSDDSRIGVEILGTSSVEIDGETLRRTDVRFFVKPDAPVGSISEQATIRTNDDRAPTHGVQVVATIDGDLDVLPNRLPLGMIRQGSAFEKTIRVHSRSKNPFVITGAAMAPDSLIKADVAFAPAESGSAANAWVITIKGTAPNTVGLIRGELVVTTDIAGEETLRIPVYGTFRADSGGGLTPSTPPPARPATPPSGGGAN